MITIAATDSAGTDTQAFQIFVTGVGGDTTPPTVTAFSYKITGSGPGTWDGELDATFSEPVEVSPIDVAILDHLNQVVSYKDLLYQVNAHRLTISVVGLANGQTYRLILADTITDEALNPLDGEWDGRTVPSGNRMAGGDFVGAFVGRVPGDLNCDGAVDFDDINPFVTALVSRAGYESRYPGCAWLNADCNGDGSVDFDDINPFVTCLVHGGCP